MTDDKMYVIWSNEHGMWWRPGRHGYTRDLDEAGFYEHADAQQICNPLNWIDAGVPNEIMLEVPAWMIHACQLVQGWKRSLTGWIDIANMVAKETRCLLCTTTEAAAECKCEGFCGSYRCAKGSHPPKDIT